MNGVRDLFSEMENKINLYTINKERQANGEPQIRYGF